MGNIFTLDSALKKTIQNALDDLITELGKTCRLVYPAEIEDCVNCSENHWVHGGPMRFMPGMNCPMCGGTGSKAVQQTEDIKLLCNIEQKKFDRIVPNMEIVSPFSWLETKGYLVDMPKIVRADYLIFDINVQGMGFLKFRLYEEPGDVSNIIQGRYFLALWKRFV